MYERIVVPLDGSKLAERALPHAEELARLTGCPIHLVRVINPADIPSPATYGLLVEASAFAEALAEEARVGREYLEETERELVERGLTVTHDVRRGGAVRLEIVEVTRPGDIVVMATHGRGGVRRWVLGSVAEEVVRHVTVPVLLVRSMVEADAAGDLVTSPASAA